MHGWGATVAAVAVAGIGLVGTLTPSQAKEPTCAPEGSALTISAQDSKFDKDCLMAPAGEAFTIAFNNREIVPHNVAIYDTANGNKVLFQGEVFVGPRTVTYSVPAQPEGYYLFQCDPHDDKMFGTFVVGSPPATTTTATTAKPPPPTTTTTLLPKFGS
jgi:plastocyanin